MEEIKYALATLLVGLFMTLVVMFGFNLCSSPVWNDGVCIDCGIKYKMKDASNQLKYYTCPKCDRKVIRY